ncbi:MAG TPA: hypothetical protein VG244_05580 [Acidimicrobiales bacterium]|nr:hypothetical protein [Acidimicrobiales bacterium]
MSEETGADGTATQPHLLRRTLDACIFAPVGVAVTVIEDLPGLIGKGRGRVEQEISNARVAGEYVVGRLQRRLSEQLDGIVHSGNGAVTVTPEHSAEATATPTPVRPAPDAADAATVGAALADYDTLSASQVVRRLESLGPDELRAVQRYEAATRNRRTILNRASQLLEPGPAQASSG